jgi:hypothetical protein
MTMSDRSAVMALIGAGPVGLGMAKALLEHKIPYEQLEADRELGGNWLHGVYETVHIISSRKTTEYADYPMPADYPDFPSRQQMLDYLRDYAQKFQLTPHIQFNTKVVMALPLADGRWELELASGEKRVYKGLIVCNGHHWDRRKFRLRYCGGSSARRKNGANQSATRLLVFAEDTVWNSFRGTDQAVASGVGAADFLAADSAHCDRKIFRLRFAGAGPQNISSASHHQ